jgi:sugar phosphate isomerase/epimerase
MRLTRREFGASALVGIAGMRWVGDLRAVQTGASARAKQEFGGVEIGIISYSFRQISYRPEDVAKGMQFLGLSVLELEQAFFEEALGAPHDPTGGGQPRLPGSEVAGGPFGTAPAHAIKPEPRREEHGGEGEDAETKAIRAELRRWRMSPPWDRVRALKNMFDEAGIEVRLVKFPQLGGQEMTDEEVDYCFEFARKMGARGLTCEPPLSQTKRLARFANSHKMIVGFHGHSNVSSVETFGRPGAWEQAFFYSPYHWANIDLGHFTAGNNYPPTDFIREYHDRITNIHLKDRKIHNGANLPWGEGDTPIEETLQLMKREKYRFPAMIELEYRIPQGSTVMDELARCVKYCKNALL